MSVNFKDKLHIWLDDVKDKAFNIFGRDKSEKEENLYETRWVWYHSALADVRFIMNMLRGININKHIKTFFAKYTGV